MRRLSLVTGALLLLTTVTTPAADVEVRGVVWVGGQPEANVVVWLDAPNAPALPARRVVLDQRNLTFFPHVLAVRVGTQVQFPNNDRVFHNVFSSGTGRSSTWACTRWARAAG